MAWAAMGSALAVGGYALLFGPSLNLAGMLLLTALIVSAERSPRAARVLERVVAGSPLPLVAPVIVNGMISAARLRALFPLHEALAASLLIALIASTATMTRRATA